MRIQFIILALVALSISACNSKPKQAEEKAMNVAQLLAVIDQSVDQEIYLTGTVNHVCTHSGRRCFMIDSTGEFSIRVEAAGQIESFSQEEIGSAIKVKGIVRENRLTAEELNQMEADVLQKHPEDAENNGENCSAEMTNINTMKEWMKNNNKDYYATYYVDGVSYEVVQ